MQFKIVLFFVFTLLIGGNSWMFKNGNSRSCPEKPNYDKCKFHVPCNPNDENPCGCPHACCAPSKTYYIAKGSNRGGRQLELLNYTSLQQTSHFCFLKGECNDICDGMWSFSDNVKKCGCGIGLKCSFNIWMGQFRCLP